MLVDVARFRADDPEALVSASLACPICLDGRGVQWDQTLREYEDSVDCRCGQCGERWRIYVEPQQALRLELLRATGH